MLEIIEEYEVFKQNKENYTLEERKRIRDQYREAVNKKMFKTFSL